jgi:putative oxidoreductase
MFKKLLATVDDSTLTIMRLILGIVFFAHGAQKALGWFGGFGFSGTMGFFTQQMHIPAPLAFLAICAEFLGGLGLIFGFLTRIAAFGVAVNMLVAVLMVHRHIAFRKARATSITCLRFLAMPIIVRGAGSFSIDRALSREEVSRPA